MNIYSSALEMYNIALKEAPTFDFVGKIDLFTEENALIETELFDMQSLKYYAKKNCGMEVSEEEKKIFETEYRGGSQGDYSFEMNEKIDNVVESLVSYPSSKRAVIMMNNKWWSHQDTDEAKCCREIHFRLTPLESNKSEWKLNCTGFFRAQAVDIMPKNFYFVFNIMDVVRQKIVDNLNANVEIGSYTHFVTILVPTRYD
tara:strand:+ start:798 stop:1400 length:603 start_codon:yes stop_codon:yes gene_type:complete